MTVLAGLLFMGTAESDVNILDYCTVDGPFSSLHAAGDLA